VSQLTGSNADDQSLQDPSADSNQAEQAAKNAARTGFAQNAGSNQAADISNTENSGTEPKAKSSAPETHDELRQMLQIIAGIDIGPEQEHNIEVATRTGEQIIIQAMPEAKLEPLPQIDLNKALEGLDEEIQAAPPPVIPNNPPVKKTLSALVAKKPDRPKSTQTGDVPPTPPPGGAPPEPQEPKETFEIGAPSKSSGKSKFASALSQSLLDDDEPATEGAPTGETAPWMNIAPKKDISSGSLPAISDGSLPAINPTEPAQKSTTEMAFTDFTESGVQWVSTARTMPPTAPTSAPEPEPEIEPVAEAPIPEPSPPPPQPVPPQAETPPAAPMPLPVEPPAAVSMETSQFQPLSQQGPQPEQPPAIPEPEPVPPAPTPVQQVAPEPPMVPSNLEETLPPPTNFPLFRSPASMGLPQPPAPQPAPPAPEPQPQVGAFNRTDAERWNKNDQNSTYDQIPADEFLDSETVQEIEKQLNSDANVPAISADAPADPVAQAPVQEPAPAQPTLKVAPEAPPPEQVSEMTPSRMRRAAARDLKSVADSPDLPTKQGASVALRVIIVVVLLVCMAGIGGWLWLSQNKQPAADQQSAPMEEATSGSASKESKDAPVERAPQTVPSDDDKLSN